MRCFLTCLKQCSATFFYLRHTKTTSKFLRHTSAKKRRKFTHQITVTTVQWDQQFNGMLGVVVTSSIAACWALYLKWQLESSRSISFEHDRLSFLINTNVEKLCSHNYVVQNWRRISRAFSEICLYSFPTAIQNSSRVISRNFNRSVLSFRSSRKFSLIGNDNFCVEISALTEKGFRIQSYCYELIAKK